MYTALYRIWRPTLFKDVIDQDNITKILKYQIKSDKIGHAYLFCGGRGTGKTSTAKIFAKAVNCLNPHDGEPCNECDICRGINEGTIVDISEIDAASNNSVDNIRDIIDNVIYVPTFTKYKVYIIDEVHMLSIGAFNALLKTLEEPPAHVIFILATTEPHKIPATILSRCQRFEFKKISIDGISTRLSEICQANEITIEPTALNIIARVAEGAMRDAISILDQCISSGTKNITEEDIRNLIGVASSDNIINLLKNIFTKSIPDTLNILAEITSSGKDIRYLLWELTRFCRDILLYKVTNETELIYNYTDLEQIKELSNSISPEKLSYLISYFSELENKIKYASQPLILLEAALIKLSIEENKDMSSYEERLNDLENKIKNYKPVAIQSVSQQTSNTANTQSTPRPAPKVLIPGDNFSEWPNILNKLKATGKIMLYGALVNTTASYQDNTINIIFNKNGTFGKSVVEKPENASSLKDAILSVTGQELNFKCLLESSLMVESPLDDLESRLKSNNLID